MKSDGGNGNGVEGSAAHRDRDLRCPPHRHHDHPLNPHQHLPGEKIELERNFNWVIDDQFHPEFKPCAHVPAALIRQKRQILRNPRFLSPPSSFIIISLRPFSPFE